MATPVLGFVWTAMCASWLLLVAARSGDTTAARMNVKRSHDSYSPSLEEIGAEHAVNPDAVTAPLVTAAVVYLTSEKAHGQTAKTSSRTRDAAAVLSSQESYVRGIPPSLPAAIGMHASPLKTDFETLKSFRDTRSSNAVHALSRIKDTGFTVVTPDNVSYVRASSKETDVQNLKPSQENSDADGAQNLPPSKKEISSFKDTVKGSNKTKPSLAGNIALTGFEKSAETTQPSDKRVDSTERTEGKCRPAFSDGDTVHSFAKKADSEDALPSPGDKVVYPGLPPAPDINVGPCPDKCTCTNESAVCFGIFLDMRPWGDYIPSFKHNILKLKLARNGIRIQTSHYFKNVINITELDLTNNGIPFVHPKAFSLLKHLKILHFGGNYLKYRSNETGMSLQTIFSIPTLEELYLTGSSLRHLGQIPLDLFKAHFKSNLTTLWLDHTELQGSILLSIFSPLTKLRELNVNSANLKHITPAFLASLERLSAFDNNLEYIPNLCNYDPFFPKLVDLDVRRNRINQMFAAPLTCDANMISLRASHNEVLTIPSFTFVYVRPKVLFLMKALSTNCTIEERAFHSRSLVEIDLSLNGLDFASDTVSADGFLRSDYLSVLHLNGNTFRHITEGKFGRLMDPLRSLKVLTLTNTQLDHISKRMVEGLKNVTTILLSNNMLRVIPGGTFDVLELLTTLRLDNNLIITVSESTFGPSLRNRLRSLNLSSNPFECTCSLLWFRQWLRKEPALFDYPNSPYKCSNIAGADVANFVMNQQQCLLSHEAYVAIAVCFTLFILTLTVVTLLHRYRWHIRLLLYEAYRGERLARWRYRLEEDFQYDLFVSYDSEDCEWVLGELVPVLEQQMGLRLCVHQRDFIPGKNIVDNILDCLQVSKRVLAVFSPQFAQSQWCHFELNLCLSHVVDNDDVIVVVMLQDVPVRDVTGAMSAVMKTTTYIEWGDEAEAVVSFWRRMTLALTDVLPALQQ